MGEELRTSAVLIAVLATTLGVAFWLVVLMTLGF